MLFYAEFWREVDQRGPRWGVEVLRVMFGAFVFCLVGRVNNSCRSCSFIAHGIPTFCFNNGGLREKSRVAVVDAFMQAKVKQLTRQFNQCHEPCDSGMLRPSTSLAGSTHMNERSSRSHAACVSVTMSAVGSRQ